MRSVLDLLNSSSSTPSAVAFAAARCSLGTSRSRRFSDSFGLFFSATCHQMPYCGPKFVRSANLPTFPSGKSATVLVPAGIRLTKRSALLVYLCVIKRVQEGALRLLSPAFAHNKNPRSRLCAVLFRGRRVTAFIRFHQIVLKVIPSVLAPQILRSATILISK